MNTAKKSQVGIAIRVYVLVQHDAVLGHCSTWALSLWTLSPSREHECSVPAKLESSVPLVFSAGFRAGFCLRWFLRCSVPLLERER